MDGWLAFALERYNYWIVILLMMTGLYIVFARGNLVKKVVGLTLFQTSVFIFYLTMGKIAGGTAPIFKSEDLDHGESLHETPEAAGQAIGESAAGSDSLHAKIENTLTTEGGNDLKAALKDLGPTDKIKTAPSLHEAPAGADTHKIANDALANIQKPEASGFDIAGAGDSLHGADSANALSDIAHNAAETVYTNPLPSVLILTAIVVGVATTAVALALAVRIREAYGTIEEDELEAADDVAEFGEAAQAATDGAGA